MTKGLRNISPRHEILGCEFDAVSEQDVLEIAAQILNSEERGWIFTVNAAILVEMAKNTDLRKFSNSARMVVADGQSIIWLSRLMRLALPERITGIDLTISLSRLAASEGRSVYLLGATEEVSRLAARNLSLKIEKLNIAGHKHGYFKKNETDQIVTDIRKSGAEILIIGMGVPRQERFLLENWEELGVSLAIPVGGSFDVLSGKLKRAPVLIQRLGLEWFYRFLQEPRRLAKRYFVSNSQFIWMGAKTLWQMKSKP